MNFYDYEVDGENIRLIHFGNGDRITIREKVQQ